MSRRFQVGVKGLFAQVTLVAVGFGCFQSIGVDAGPFWSACLLEITAATWGAAYGLFRGKPALFAIAIAIAMLPLAWWTYCQVLDQLMHRYP